MAKAFRVIRTDRFKPSLVAVKPRICPRGSPSPKEKGMKSQMKIKKRFTPKTLESLFKEKIVPEEKASTRDPKSPIMAASLVCKTAKRMDQTKRKITFSLGSTVVRR
jgi:hypothetical protein